MLVAHTVYTKIQLAGEEIENQEHDGTYVTTNPAFSNSDCNSLSSICLNAYICQMLSLCCSHSASVGGSLSGSTGSQSVGNWDEPGFMMQISELDAVVLIQCGFEEGSATRWGRLMRENPQTARRSKLLLFGILCATYSVCVIGVEPPFAFLLAIGSQKLNADPQGST